jgi:hypothetical protein
METVFLILALIGLVILVVGGVLYFIQRPPHPNSIVLMVVGAVVYAIAQIVLVFDALF